LFAFSLSLVSSSTSESGSPSLHLFERPRATGRPRDDVSPWHGSLVLSKHQHKIIDQFEAKLNEPEIQMVF